MLFIAVLIFSIATGTAFAIVSERIEVRKKQFRKEKIEREVNEIKQAWYEDF